MQFRSTLVLASLCLGLAASPAAAGGNDAILSKFFAIWDNDGQVTLQAVQQLYADRVFYYGRPMTSAAVYGNKRDFIRRWSTRHYAVVPGTSVETCERTRAHCGVDVTLAWSASSAARGASAAGWTRVSLDLVRQNGDLKIDRETGRPVGRP